MEDNNDDNDYNSMQVPIVYEMERWEGPAEEYDWLHTSGWENVERYVGYMRDIGTSEVYWPGSRDVDV